MLMRCTVLATQAIANVVKSSFGPSGLDKMMVDDIGVSVLSSTPRHFMQSSDWQYRM
jgi:chaperonin GroEL (HSP60 family)